MATLRAAAVFRVAGVACGVAYVHGRVILTFGSYRLRQQRTNLELLETKNKKKGARQLGEEKPLSLSLSFFLHGFSYLIPMVSVPPW